MYIEERLNQILNLNEKLLSLVDNLKNEVSVLKKHSLGENPKFPEKLYTRTNAAKYLGVSVTTFDRIKHNIYSTMVGKTARYKEKDLDAYVVRFDLNSNKIN